MLVTERPDVARAEASEPGPATGFGRSTRRQVAVALVSYIVLAVVYFAGAWSDPAHRVVGSPGDPSLFIWYLRWVPWAIAHGHNPLFSTYVNAPHGVNLMWNTSMILPSIVLAPITTWWSPLVSYNIIATASLALSGWTAYLAFRLVCRVGHGPAWLGGLVFAWSPFIVSQVYGHVHMSAAFLLPVLAVAAHEVLVGQRVRARWGGLALGLVAAAQFLTGEELLAIAAIALVVATVTTALLHRDQVARRLPHARRAAPWALGSFLAVAGVPLAYQFLGPQAVHGPAQPQDHYVTDLLQPVMPTLWQWIRPSSAEAIANHFLAHSAEWDAYLGIPLVLLMAVLPFVLRRRGVTVAALTALVLTVLSFGPHLHYYGHNTGLLLPWAAIGWAVPLDSVLPVRLFVGVALIAAGMIAMLAAAARRARTTRARAFGAVALLVALLPVIPRIQYRASRLTVPAFFTSAAVREIPADSYVVMAPYPEPPNVATLRWQVASGFRFRLSGGYALVPGDHGKPSFIGPMTSTQAVLDALQRGVPARLVDARTVNAMLGEVHTRRATAVVVGPMAHADQVVALFTSLFGRPPRQVGGVALWTGVQSLLAP